MTRRAAAVDPRLVARVLSRRPLRYAEGPDPAIDRPGHVRAGSGLAWFAGRLVVVQDDACFLGLVDPRSATTAALTLPAGAGGLRQFDAPRGNKAAKLDLEACCVVEADGGPLLLAFGSGSTPARERLLVLREGAAPALVDAAGLYAALRARVDFAGSQLNLEGAAPHGDDVVLFQRGNGAPRGGLLPVDATCRLDRRALLAHLGGGPAPEVREVEAWELGALGVTRLGFTDAAAGPGGRLLYLAAAEASPDVQDDGPVEGTVLGVIDEFLGVVRGRHAPLVDVAGAPALVKAEGLALDPSDPGRAWVVVDEDDPAAPAALLEVRLEGPWLEG